MAIDDRKPRLRWWSTYWGMAVLAVAALFMLVEVPVVVRRVRPDPGVNACKAMSAHKPVVGDIKVGSLEELTSSRAGFAQYSRKLDNVFLGSRDQDLRRHGSALAVEMSLLAGRGDDAEYSSTQRLRDEMAAVQHACAQHGITVENGFGDPSEAEFGEKCSDLFRPGWPIPPGDGARFCDGGGYRKQWPRYDCSGDRSLYLVDSVPGMTSGWGYSGDLFTASAGANVAADPGFQKALQGCYA